MITSVRDALRLRPDMNALDNQAHAMGAQIVEYRSDYLSTVKAVAGYAALGVRAFPWRITSTSGS